MLCCCPVRPALLFGLSGYEPLLFAAAAAVLSLVAFVQAMDALRYQ